VTRTIQQSELRNNNADIMRRVADGESFEITVHGRLVAHLTPHRGVYRLVDAASFDAALATVGPLPDPARWERDMAESDALFDDDQPEDPWERGR
jgi:prevent-host-death family protein